MRQLGWVTLGLALLAAAAAPPSRAEEVKAKAYGTGPAYETLGKLAVLHSGRLKPLDTLAREDVRHIFGRETIKLVDPAKENAVVASWSPVAAVFDWSVRPEFWDDQPIILVDYLPLRRLILGESITTRLNGVAEKGTTSEADRSALKALAADREITAQAINAFLAKASLQGEDKTTVAVVAAELEEGHKWLTPHQIRGAKVAVEEGQPVPIETWIGSIQQKRRAAGAMAAPKLSEVEKRAEEAARRLMTYEAIRDRDIEKQIEPLLVLPRPSNKEYLSFLAKTYDRAQQVGPRGLSTFEMDGARALDTYWNELPRDERKVPGEDAGFDKEFAPWLATSSVWSPLRMFLDTDVKVLGEAGYPADKLEAFLTTFKDLERAEEAAPGEVDPAKASAFVAAARALGTDVSPARYPTVAEIDRETYFNATNPFWKAPIAYAVALAVLAMTLGFLGAKSGWMSLTGRAFYAVGMIALLAGIALEVVGFYYRVRISGWAPVTNMYETVIWVSLVAAVLGVVFEAIFRRAYVGVAASGVALLGTVLAANVPLLDPNIKQLQPVLRSNYWLTIHVITEVSSYGAFLLAAFLGIIACLFYLTATYRRTPGYGATAFPILAGLPFLAAGAGGLMAAAGSFGTAWDAGKVQYFTVATLACVGVMISLSGVLAVVGEAVARLLFKEEEAAVEADSGEEVAVYASAGAGAMAVGSSGGGVATLAKPSVAEIRAATVASLAHNKGDARTRAMQATAGQIKPLSNFIYRTMQVGVLLIAAGTILGGVWADYSWGRFWGWDPKEVWALITLLVYLIPLHGRFAGWINTFALVVSSVVCSMSVIMAWYGVNFVLGVGLHSYGFVEGGGQFSVFAVLCAVLALPLAAGWRRHLGSRAMA